MPAKTVRTRRRSILGCVGVRPVPAPSPYSVYWDGARHMSNRPEPSDLPPFSAYAETAILAGILLADDHDHEIISTIAGILSPADFFREQNAWVYAACLKAWRAGDPTTVPCIARYMLIDGTLDPAGAEPFLVELAGLWVHDHTIGIAMFPEYAYAHARVIVDYAQRRRGVERAGQAARDAMAAPPREDINRTGEMPA